MNRSVSLYFLDEGVFSSVGGHLKRNWKKYALGAAAVGGGALLANPALATRIGTSVGNAAGRAGTAVGNAGKAVANAAPGIGETIKSGAIKSGNVIKKTAEAGKGLFMKKLPAIPAAAAQATVT